MGGPRGENVFRFYPHQRVWRNFVHIIITSSALDFGIFKHDLFTLLPIVNRCCVTVTLLRLYDWIGMGLRKS